MGICSEYNIAGLRIAHLRHKLMTDTVRPVEMLKSLLLHKGVPDLEMPYILHRTGRHQMVIDQHNLILIPDFLKSHLTEFIHHKRDKDIMYHHPVYFHRLDLSRRYGRLTGISHHNFLN